MKISKHDVNKWFAESLEIFNKNIMEIGYNFSVYFENDEEFIKSARNNEMNQLMISMGLFKDFDNNYPGFAYVSVYDKKIQMLMDTLNIKYVYKVNVSLDRINKFLSKFKREQIHEYIKYTFIHELVHLTENELQIKYKKCYDALFNDFSKEFAAELFPEVFNNKFCKRKIINEMYELIYHKLIPNYNEINKKDSDITLDKYIDMI